MIVIQRNDLCCGCGACLQICPQSSITFKEDNEGFLYPEININTCIDCGLCERVCPVLNQNKESEPLHVYAVKNDDEDVLLKSSSGGVFTMLAEKTIKDGGVIFGAKFNADWCVIHDYTDTVEGLEPFMGSKYVQSVIGETYNQAETFLKEGRKVMFSGTPCQIAGLRKFLRKDYENLLTVDFVCHGVPSPLVWRKYLQEEIARQSDAGKNTVFASPKDAIVLTGVNFRDKSVGWKKYSFVLSFSKMSAVREQNTVLSSVFTDNDYMSAFLTNLSLRPSCYNCPVKAGKSGADITIGDFWGIDKILPNLDSFKGVSIVLINNKKNIDILHKLKCELEEVVYKDAIKENVHYYTSASIPVNRRYFFKEIVKNGFGRSYIKTTSHNLFSRIRRYVFRLLH